MNGKDVKKIRKQMGLSQSELSLKLGKGKQYIYNVERGIHGTGRDVDELIYKIYEAMVPTEETAQETKKTAEETVTDLNFRFARIVERVKYLESQLGL